MHGRLDIKPKLHAKGLVQPETGPEIRDEFLIGRTGLARHDGGRITGGGVDQQEVEDQDGQ